ncbi:helix-turn-helix transcriptional regulator [Gaoshiqia sediminis]|uniref:WYL domain-containing protein n=1 Tax=Gaoshiqia sediminis TaxID=2986998 RepID=A0AA41Y941_9BACT|nr:WYL domain-containing protein [Gaoshiqia sediminis]MCW0484170.1 WYL domain-containing protein [Gaoshiqia sediminis]
MSHSTKSRRLLKLILFLSCSYPKSKEECLEYLGIGDSAFYNYRNDLIEIGFNLIQKDGKYWIEHHRNDHQVLQNILHFTEEESWLLSQTIDFLDIPANTSLRLKQKLTSFLNQDKTIGSYLHKEKSFIVQTLRKAQKEKKQVLLVNYASGNSQTVKNRLVEPFEFREDFNLLWAFDTALKQNRQFKICRIEDVQLSPLGWEHERRHRTKPVDIFRNTGDLDKRVELLLSLKARNLLIEEYPLTERYISKISNSQYLLKAPVAKYEGPGRFALGLAEDVQTIGDPGFLEYLKEKIKKYSKLIL